MDKIMGLLARPSDGPADDTPWYLKYGGRALGIVGAFFAILFGLWNCVSILLANVSCLVSGILQMIAGFVVMALEAPFCCMFIDHVQTLSNKVESKPVYMKGALYCAIAIPPVILCPGLGSIFGCGLIFATGVIYGMIGLGKKAPVDEMRRAAAAQQTQQQTPSNPKNFFSSSSNDTASIANNMSPTGKTNPPSKSPFDSNV